jgi:hypothetical protein
LLFFTWKNSQEIRESSGIRLKFELAVCLPQIAVIFGRFGGRAPAGPGNTVAAADLAPPPSPPGKPLLSKSDRCRLLKIACVGCLFSVFLCFCKLIAAVYSSYVLRKVNQQF